MANILAVDDEQSLLIMLKKILEKDGHIVTIAENPSMIDYNRLSSFDLILLDIMMPAIDGFTFLKQIRDRVDCPVIFLSAKQEEDSLVYGLGIGADDYICKPFGAAELRARVAAHLRREHREHTCRLAFENACFNLSAGQLLVNGTVVPLTKSEYRICELLARNTGQVFSREQIYEKVFGFDGESSETTISTHIKNIRLKLEAFQYEPIKTVWGIGYKWEK